MYINIKKVSMYTKNPIARTGQPGASRQTFGTNVLKGLYSSSGVKKYCVV